MQRIIADLLEFVQWRSQNNVGDGKIDVDAKKRRDRLFLVSGFRAQNSLFDAIERLLEANDDFFDASVAEEVQDFLAVHHKRVVLVFVDRGELGLGRIRSFGDFPTDVQRKVLAEFITLIPMIKPFQCLLNQTIQISQKLLIKFCLLICRKSCVSVKFPEQTPCQRGHRRSLYQFNGELGGKLYCTVKNRFSLKITLN